MAEGLQNIGNILAGFGAGVQGQGPQFLQGLDQRKATQQKLSEERKTALVQDVAVGLDHLENNRLDMATQLFSERINAIKQLGGDPTESQDTLNDLQAGDIDKVKDNLKGVVRAAQIRGVLPDTPSSKFLKTIGNKALFQKADGSLDVQDLGESGVEVSEGKEVKSSKILPGGNVQVVFKDGTTDLLTLEEAKVAKVMAAEERGAQLQGLRAQEREVGKGGAKIALESFDRVGKVRENISDLQEGIRLVRDEGAETGPIASQFPSIKASSIKLDQLQKKLGLNVVGAVTFGALSKGELDLAKDVALPKNLSEPEIIKWMEARIIAQEKLANNLEDAALFLAEPGNTVAGFIRQNRESAKQQAAQPETAEAQVQPAAAPKFLGFE